MSVCILEGGLEVAVLAASLFTLSWTHSVEKVEWHETWLVGPSALKLVEARIRGSGAGMEPPADARLRDGWWIYAPDLAAVPELRLAASGRTQGGWHICAAGECREIGAAAGSPVILRPCR